MTIHNYIDFTLLKSDATQMEIEKLCVTADNQHFAAVCVPPMYVSWAKELLKESSVKVCSVVGFPLGYGHWEGKMWEARWLIAQGADELDMVINVAEVKNGHWGFVKQEIARFIDICQQENIVSKIILEVTLLNLVEIQHLCMILNELKPDFAKTSTGFTGISIWEQKEKVALMNETLIPSIPMKISGGVRTAEQAIFFIENYNVRRIGASALF